MANIIEQARKQERLLWLQYLDRPTEDNRQVWAQAHEQLRKVISEEWRKFTTSG